MRDHPLEGLRIAFLGSSVTYGACSGGIAVPELLAEKTGCESWKEAVSGTTLADALPESYVARLERIDAAEVDLFVCQLSTNDAARGMPPGSVTAPDCLNGPYDTGTVAGAIEHILCRVRQRWGCPVLFYTNPPFDSPAYQRMVDLLHALRDKWGFAIADLWEDRDFQHLAEGREAEWLHDPVHPTLAGYRDWWLPYFEASLTRLAEEADTVSG